jgi:hypothetical protein
MENFWLRKDINTALSGMKYHRETIMKGNNYMHQDGTDNYYRYWRWQSHILHHLDIYKSQHPKPPKPVPTIKYKRTKKWNNRETKPYMTAKEEKEVVEEVWTPQIVLCWD